MKITTKHLLIKSWESSDSLSFFNLTQDEGFRLFPITSYKQDSVESASRWIEEAKKLNVKGLGKFAVWDANTLELVGMGGLTPWLFGEEKLIDITYRFRQSAWGKGLGWELAQALVRYGFEELRLTQITATITPDNVASKKIALKLGMKFDQHITLLGVPTDLYRLYSV